MMETGDFIDINQHTCYKWLANIMITWNRIVCIGHKARNW
jgi:hypothetical protein